MTAPMEKPDRETAYGSLCAFDDKSEGFLAISALQGIWGMNGEPLKQEEMDALFLELNNGIAENGKVTIDALLDFIYREEDPLFKANNYEFVQKQLDAAVKLGGKLTK